MKYSSLKLVLVLFTLFAFTSCKKDDDSTPIDDPKAENRKGLGLSAEDILSSDIYPNLTVELVFANFYKPTETAVNELRDFLNTRLNKVGNISIVETIIQPSPGAPFTIQEIKDLEDENRTIYTTDDTIAIYIFFSNGSSENDTNSTVTLGSAYLNTSIVIYEKTLKDLVDNNPNIDLAILESSTLQHELGHILGLVNIQNDDIHTIHEDTSHSKHCMVEDCLMYFESSNGRSLLDMLRSNNQVPALDPLCIEDLQAKGGK
jgi:predicted Zn-dependent protease